MKEKELFSEAGINIEDKTYTIEETKTFSNKVVEHIMSFSKDEIPEVKKKYDDLLYKIS